jgi:replicative DNA helicase
MSKRRPERDGQDAESAVLGAMILTNEVIGVVRRIVQAADFSAPHSRIFNAICGLTDRQRAVDLITLPEELAGDLDTVGGLTYLSSLPEAVPAPGNVEHYARIVAEHSRKRRLAMIAEEIARHARNGQSSAEIIADVDRQLDQLRAVSDGGAVSVADALKEPSSQTTYVPSGLHLFDRAIGGLPVGEMVVVGAWSGHGKSAFLSHCAHAAATADVPVLIFSIEMPKRVVLDRLLSAMSGISLTAIRRGGLTEGDGGRLCDAAAKLAGLPLFIRDGAANIMEIISEANALVRRHGVKFVLVDYVQLVGSTAPDRRLQVEEIAQRLLALAVGAGVGVIAASQLRKAAQDHSAHPTMHDLRESGALFEAPHIVLLLHRPRLGEFDSCPVCEGRNPHCPNCGGTGGTSHDTTTDVIIAKNRSGPTGSLSLAWHGPTLTFANLDPGNA